MSEQVWGAIVIALIGIIIGGAGGAAIFRRATKGLMPNSTEIADTAEAVAATASSTAAVVAATAASVAAALHTEISEQLASIQNQLVNNSDKIVDLKVSITGFMGACPERHKAIEQRLNFLEQKV